MKIYVMLAMSLLALTSRPAAAARVICTPSYEVIDGELSFSIGSWTLSFHMLVVGCKENLLQRWPPKREDIQRVLALELQDQHPLQALGLIRERSPALRRRLVKRVNKVLGASVVQDLFLFDVKASEAI